MADKNFISRIKLADGSYVYLKDSELRAALGAAAYQAVASSISDTGLPSAATVKNYVDAQVGAINKFDIVVANSLPTASADTMYKIYMIPKDPAQTSNAKDEYITIRSGTDPNYTYAWEKIGDTEVDLSAYAKTEDLGDFAFADTGSAEVELVSSIEMNPVEVSGSISISAEAASATVSYGEYTPSGAVTLSGIDLTTASATVVTGYSQGSAASIDVTKFSGGSKAADTFSAGSMVTGATYAATEGLMATVNTSATVGAEDYEVLTFVAASTANFVNNVTYTAPSFTEGTFTAATINDGFFTANVPGSATSGSVDLVTGAQAGTFTFSGNTATIAVTGVSYNLASGSAQFAQTITPTVKTINKSTATLTVNPVTPTV